MGAIRLGDYLTLGAYQHFWPSGGCCILELGEFLRFGAYSNKYGINQRYNTVFSP